MSEHTAQATIERDCIEVVTAYFDYSPRQKQTRKDPGIDAELTFNRVLTVTGNDILPGLDSKTLEIVKDACWDYVNSILEEKWDV